MAMFRRVIGTFNRNLRLMWFLSLMTRGNPISNDGERRIHSASSDTTTARSWTYRQTARCQLTKDTGKPCVSRIKVSLMVLSPKWKARPELNWHLRFRGPRPYPLDDAPVVASAGVEPASRD